MSKKVLLLTVNYEFNSFVEINRAIRLLFVGKVEAMSYWEEFIHYPSGKMKLPAIIKLNYPIKRFNYNKSIATFNRSSIIKRDKSTCQYCQKILSSKEITIDHVIPRSQGGKNSFNNCVVCCFSCNKKKGNKTLEQVGMQLISKPSNPSLLIYSGNDNKDWHPDWHFYIK